MLIFPVGLFNNYKKIMDAFFKSLEKLVVYTKTINNIQIQYHLYRVNEIKLSILLKVYIIVFHQPL
jgi:hypothetical protein